MALTAAGLIEPARRAFDWCRRQQRADGSLPIQLRAGVVEDANSDSNFCAYVAVGVWHHVLVTGDRAFAASMWPTVRAAIDFVLELQLEGGEICWARSPSGPLTEALLTGCASIFHSIRCALALANLIDEPQLEWELALGRLGHAISDHPSAFTEKPHHSMDWYYPILGGALRGRAAQDRIADRWGDFVVDGLGIRCVDDRPWVTGAETCELVLALDAMGNRQAALQQFAAMQHLRETDGSYWPSFSPPTHCRPPPRAAASSAAPICRAVWRATTTASVRPASPIVRPAPRPRPRSAPAPASTR
jgi:hypothetical protein